MNDIDLTLLGRRAEHLQTDLDKLLAQVGTLTHRVEAVEGRLNELDRRVGEMAFRLERRLDDFERRVEARLDAFEQRLDEFEERLGTRLDALVALLREALGK